MQVYIAGIHHYDPLCKARLHNWLQNLLDIKVTLPAFVAVEWDEILFKQVKLQRPIIRKLAMSRWSQSTTEFLDALESTLAFDADTHTLLMPNIQTVWLENGRVHPNIMPEVVNNFAFRRFQVYENYIPVNATNFDNSLLYSMSINAWDESDIEGGHATNRDAKFAETIINHLAEKEETAWAIIVVGYYHGRQEPDWMAHRLTSAGVNCETTELRP